MYQLLRNILFNFDAEAVHHFSMKALKGASEVEFINKALFNNFSLEDQRLAKTVFGLYFKNPVGLGAGFDKNALYIKELEALGFGFIEIGTVTPRPQVGNDKPRLFRLPDDKAIINRMGFNNNGVKEVAARLRQTKRNIIIGGNIGKNKDTPNEDAWKDYEICFNELFNYVDYFVVNVSSPNTPGLRQLQEKSSLQKILGHLQTINNGKLNPKPLLLKIAPDITIGQLDDIIELSQEVELAGLVATNTTISRENLVSTKQTVDAIGAGGLSGKPVKSKSTEIVKYITTHTNGSLPVIASGGIFTGADAEEKLKAGASLLQVWTGFIYEGPSIVKNICNHLLQHHAY
ncbi:MAG: quinone-dependent dihydroorotate dehydrogenase [Segetibacter sp.]|nr:quinone-dependent dihydroorotate dehydrogenase [Segetibacter sp.]